MRMYTKYYRWKKKYFHHPSMRMIPYVRFEYICTHKIIGTVHIIELLYVCLPYYIYVLTDIPLTSPATIFIIYWNMQGLFVVNSTGIGWKKILGIWKNRISMLVSNFCDDINISVLKFSVLSLYFFIRTLLEKNYDE